ncbi:ADP-ribosyltransferase domain-containing protein [Chitinophaga flava]|uniref:NAD(+)--protein-arginine ADP-ribosyltransferase n=1 Tax=Chitinophaga flava TaxID=2259036 RepID=A0A365XW13_9BACT|nr:ADP-ribosyltransferase domain-containing protein [Chitinophaga flava]RBL90523.1 hypothetical protein DF182_29135 [Chitinophaga flava]
MALQLIDSFTIDNANGSPTLQLCMGDLTNLSSEDAVDFLVVSASPGDYSASSGSLIGSLAQAGVSVQQLSNNKAANYEPKIPCWISNTISSSNSGIQFNRILLFEPTNPSTDAAGLVWTIFQALNCFQGGSNTTVALPMVCTGSGGASYQDIIQALFYAATFAGSLSAFSMPVIKLVAYDNDKLNQVQPTFSTLKNYYQNLVNLDLPGNYQSYAPDAWSAVQGISLPDRLTKRQAFAVRMWTSNYYGMINSTLRNGSSDQNYYTLMPLFSAIDSGLANIAAFQGETYRGESHMSPQRLAQYQVGANILELGYTSSAQPAGSWYNGASYKFNINGLNSHSIAFLSVYPGEDEYLYARNMTSTVTERSCNDGNSQCTFTMQQTTINYCSADLEEFISKTVIAIY